MTTCPNCNGGLWSCKGLDKDGNLITYKSCADCGWMSNTK